MSSYLYVVKSSSNCYASYEPVVGVKDADQYIRLAWTEDKSMAAYFTSKDAARALADACHPAAEARVYRVKR